MRTLSGVEQAEAAPAFSSSWESRAGCGRADVDPDQFYPVDIGRGASASYRAPGRVCAACPVALECLVAAVDGEEHGYQYGMRAGLTPHDRGRPLLVAKRLRVLANMRAAGLPGRRLPDGLHRLVLAQLATLVAREQELAPKREAKRRRARQLERARLKRKKALAASA
jgi:hypothetical protein